MAFNFTFRGPEHFVSEYAQEWQDIYDKRNYYFVDPILIWNISKQGNIRWSEVKLPDVRGVLTECKKFNMNFGASFSRKINGKRSVLALARSDREFTDDEISHLSDKFDFLADCVLGQCGLTDKELEVLRDLRDGSTYKDIGERLEISVPTVKARAEKARKKLGAKTTMQAVASASIRNFI